MRPPHLCRKVAAIIAGGTDLLGALRFEILPTHPEVVVNLNSIPGLGESLGGNLALIRLASKFASSAELSNPLP